MIKYEIKPSVKLIYATIKSCMIYGDNPILAYILFNDFNYSTQDILKATNWNKGDFSKDLKKGLVSVNNPIKQLHRDLYLKKINEKFQIYLVSINKEMLHLQEK